MKAQLLSIILAVVILLAVGEVRAALVFFDTADPVVMPGETISVSIFSMEPTVSIRMDRISNDGEGTASNLYLNPGYDWAAGFDEGTVINSGVILIEGVRGELGTPGSPTVAGILYSFDYTVPIGAIQDQIISIFADSSGGAINEINVIGMIDNVTPESLSLTVIPEPTTILLIGFGGLLLRNTEPQNPATNC